MTTMIAEVYHALKSAGAEDVLARRAAEAMSKIDERRGSQQARLDVLQWMVGVNIALTLLVFGSLITLWAHVGLK